MNGLEKVHHDESEHEYEYEYEPIETEVRYTRKTYFVSNNFVRRSTLTLTSVLQTEERGTR